MNKKQRRRLNKIEKMLEIPSEIYSNTPKITITGFDEIIIENYKAILEYEDYFVRINTYEGLININGYELSLENLTDDDIKVKGKIESLDFERVSD